MHVRADRTENSARPARPTRGPAAAADAMRESGRSSPPNGVRRPAAARDRLEEPNVLSCARRRTASPRSPARSGALRRVMGVGAPSHAMDYSSDVACERRARGRVAPARVAASRPRGSASCAVPSAGRVRRLCDRRRQMRAESVARGGRAAACCAFRAAARVARQFVSLSACGRRGRPQLL